MVAGPSAHLLDQLLKSLSKTRFPRRSELVVGYPSAILTDAVLVELNAGERLRQNATAASPHTFTPSP
jgi:hypothetical protein